MKLIEALKQTKDLQRQVEDLTDKVRTHCALSSVETPVYPDQRGKVREWMQGVSDTLKEILRLRTAIQATNLATKVTIELDGKSVTKSIAEWIHRRRDLADQEMALWKALSDRGVSEGLTKSPTGDVLEIKVVRFYDPEERDRMVERYRAEPTKIDSTLEVVNAVTDLIE